MMFLTPFEPSFFWQWLKFKFRSLFFNLEFVIMISCSCHLVPDGHILQLPVTMLFRHVCSLHMDGKMFGQNLMFIIVLCGGCHPSQSNLKFTIVFFFFWVDVVRFTFFSNPDSLCSSESETYKQVWNGYTIVIVHWVRHHEHFATIPLEFVCVGCKLKAKFLPNLCFLWAHLGWNFDPYFFCWWRMIELRVAWFKLFRKS